MTELPVRLRQDQKVRWRLAVVTLAAVLFGLLAVAVSSAPRDAADRRVEGAVHQFALRHPPAVTAARVLTYLGNTAVLAVLLLLAAVVLVRTGRARSVVPLIAVPAVVWATQNLIKDVIQRPRPVFVHAIAHAPGWAFPSGHAADSTATYGAIAMALAVRRAAQRIVATVAAVLVIVVCTTRVVLGVHWLSDVIGGVLLALTVLTAASAVRTRQTTAV